MQDTIPKPIIKDKILKNILETHGLPIIQKRKEGFKSMCHIILEQQVSIASANADYSAQLSANSKAYQKALADNRTEWRKSVEMNRAKYLAELERIKALGTTKQTRTQNSLALKSYIATQKKISADYAASKPAALSTKNFADNSALDAKNAAIAKANSTYAAFIESIGYGVMVP
jgi:hypothetical protein